MKKLLIIVDMLNDFCHANGVLSKSTVTGKRYAASIISKVMQILKVYRSKEDPIIFLCDSHAENDKEFKRFPPHAITNTWGADIIEELRYKTIASSPNELIVRKKRYSGFYGTILGSYLFQLAPAEVTVVGVCTSICVMDTVGGLANRDFKTIVPRNSVADFSPSAHTAAIGRMEALYGAKII